MKLHKQNKQILQNYMFPLHIFSGTCFRYMFLALEDCYLNDGAGPGPEAGAGPGVGGGAGAGGGARGGLGSL